jgi:UDP-3-O-[3-hydroxymyristoyl] glucosamine N-acyltransferase
VSGIQSGFTLADLAQRLGAELVGDPQHHITALATLQSATPAELSFIANPVYKKYLATTKAGAVLVSPELASMVPGNKLIVANPYICYAQLTPLFDSHLQRQPGIHPSAVIGENCVIGKDVHIDAQVVLADGVVLGNEVSIGAGCYIGADSQLGDRTRLHANVTIYHGVSIGTDCLFHSGSVIGADGFGFAPSSQGWVKIHQLGGVRIGNRVEVGANSAIDRGALDDTVISDGVIIDNLVQIGHNVRLGKNTAIAGHSAVAGSVTIGENCTIAGKVGIAGHLHLADKVHVSAMTLVSGSIDNPGSYSGSLPIGPTKEWRKNAARFRQLDQLTTRLIKLERRLNSEE